MSKKLLLVVNVDWFFISHRLPIASTAIDNGYEVHLICSDTGRCDELRKLGIFTHPVEVSRSGTSLVKELSTFISIWRLMKRISPDIVHAITVKPVVYSSLIARILGVKRRVFSISGLGFLFIDKKRKTRVIRAIISWLYKIGINNSSSTVIFQNTSDQRLFKDLGIIDNATSKLIRGSGAQLSNYNYMAPMPSNPVVIFLARLLKDKGVVEFCQSAEIICAKWPAARFRLLGDLDSSNPNSISQEELAEYMCSGNVEYVGFVDDVAQQLAAASIVVLPSYREGLPKTLIEAAAAGRPVVTTDVPGCRDAVEADRTGLLVPPKDVEALVDAIDFLIENPLIASNMGRAGRDFAERTFRIEDVVATHLQIYNGSD